MKKNFRVLLVVKRFHPNLIGIDHLFSRRGVELLVIARHRGPSESSPIAAHSIMPINQRTAENVRRIILEFEPDVLIQRDFYKGSLNFWKICDQLGVKRVSYDQGPTRIGVSSFFSNPIVTLRFLVSRYLIHSSRYRENRISPVFRWGGGPCFPVGHSTFVPHPLVFDANESNEKSIQDKLEVVCVAKHGQSRKRVRWLIRAQLKSSVKFSLCLIGSAPASPIANRIHKKTLLMVERNRRAGLEVDVHTDLPREELAAKLRAASLFVLPSRSEPFAVSVLEAMAQGTPVLISSSGGAASYVLPRNNGETFFEWSYISFQKKLTRLLEDPEQLLMLGENARKKVVDECSGESLISFLDDLLTPKLQRLETQ